MAKTHYVQHAQRRYEMVPVLDAVSGEPIIVPVNRTTKTGRQVEMHLTKPDPLQPLPNYECDRCGAEIEVGAPYKWIQPKSGPYGGVKKTRCASCPAWQVWEYSSSLSAQLAQISYDFSNALGDVDSADDVQSALDEAASAVRDIAEAKRESAANMAEGFGHETEQSQDLETLADDLDSWADEIEAASIPDYPEPEEQDCEPCEGSGKMILLDEDGELEAWRPGSYADGVVRECQECHGSGTFTPDEPENDQIEAWREECQSELTIVDECPV